MSLASDVGDRIATDLDAYGWSVQPDFLDQAATTAFRNESAERRAEFHHAGTGRGAGHALQPGVRGDDVRWLGDDRDAPSEGSYLLALEALRVHLNRTLYLGLDGFEAHVAVYPAGAGYARHRDAFHGTEPGRVLSTVLYLNADWADADGGHLRLFLDGTNAEPFLDVAPTGGTLVAFLSEQIEHEVRPARRERMSVAGWFSARP
ncbi:2OG-Fe(II) oxygenase [Rubrivirga sp. IMCC43871]|uniref:2OG-Fe(II) oxygenase n=1 Tax=Rubrivirga sp. IMCC43871 TaxID=3391575 RepID=UPI00398FB97C